MNDQRDWEPRVEALEAAVSEVKAALLGKLDGKQGLLAQMDLLLTQTQRNSDQLDALRLDRAKIVGIIAAVSVIAGGIYKLFLK